MTVTLEFQHIVWIVGLMLLWGGSLIGIIRALLVRMVKDLDKRLEKQSDEHSALAAEHRRLDAEFKSFQVRLPLDYQRREDSIREFTAINMKLDRLHELVRRP